MAGFMDDLTLGGPAEIVAADIDHIRDIQEATGLCINASKCEIISRASIPLAVQFEGFIFLARQFAVSCGIVCPTPSVN